MTDRPIPFSPPMVRAILREIEQPGTGKTQTRRVLKPQPYDFPHPGDGLRCWNASGVVGGRICITDRGLLNLHRKPRAGDRLWVKEAWRVWAGVDKLPPRDLRTDAIVIYGAGGSSEASEGYRRTSEWPASESSRPKNLGRYRHARFMPRWASRITLLVTDVRVERLNDISEADAMAEGMPASVANSPRVWFMTLWNSLHGPGSWEANPWVAVYGFRPVLANIDAMEG